MNKETLGVDSQTYRVVYQRKGDKSQNNRQSQQHQADVANIIIHRIYQIFLIKHFLNVRILLDFLLYLGNAVRIGIIRMQLDLNGRRKRIVAEELLRIRSHSLCLFTKRLFLRDVLRSLYKRLFIQLLLQFEDVTLLHVVTDKNGKVDILLYIYRKIVGSQHKEHHQSQQQQYQRGAYAGRNELHIKVGYRIMFNLH